MSILSYFSTSREKAFAHSLVKGLTKDIPPALMEDRRKVLSVNKVTRLLERTYKAATQYQQENHLGFVKRAVLANSFKWELKNNAYPEDFTDLATEGLVVALSKRTGKDDTTS